MSCTVARALECPNCGAPLAHPRFARSVVCSFCQSTIQVDPSAVSAARFRDSLAAWNKPETHGYTDYSSIGGTHWATREFIASGEISDVYCAERARWPSERVLLKVLRRPQDQPLFDREWSVLEQLQRSEASGASHFTTLIPQPILHGLITSGRFAGRHALACRWADGCDDTLERVRQVYPDGVDPHVSIWMWRRILEVLAFLHRSGVVHGAVVPPHILVENGEHGIRLVGYSAAGEPGGSLPTVCSSFAAMYPDERLSPAGDVMMAARSIAFALGGNRAGGAVPGSVPGPLADLIREIASSDADDAWSVRERVGHVVRDLYGPPRFHPLLMPA